LIYILGTWHSVAAHHDFIAREKNKMSLELLKDQIIMEGEKKIMLFHLEGQLLAKGNGGEKLCFDAPVLSCNRHFVPKAKKEGFASKFGEVKGLLEEYTKPYAVKGGWRIEEESGKKEEWILFSGSESVEARSFGKYWQIVEFVETFEAGLRIEIG